MVGKRHSNGGGSAKKSPTAAEPALASRPKRNISPKCLDVTTGLSWREERELKKALYASLNDARKSTKSETSGSNSVTDGTPSKSDGSEPGTPNVRIQSHYSDESGLVNPLYSGSSRGQRSSSLPNIPVNKVAKLRQLRNASQHSETNGSNGEGQCSDTPPASSTNSRSNSLDESSQDSTSRSSFSTNAPTPQSLSTSTASSSPPEATKAKVHAQRKFASLQNCGTAGYTCYSPSSATPPVSKVPTKTSPVQMFPKRAKTEDFLTFLCLRGTPALPPHLDFFNFTRYDGTNYMSPNKSGRESSPSSTSTSLSNFNHDENGENSRTFSPVPKHITPTKKAARASAGTPETARGLQGLRPRLTKNSLKAQSPLAKSSSKIKNQVLRKRSPPKMTRSFSVPRTVKKLGMMRRSSEANPIRLSAPSKLAIKRKSETSLNSAKTTGSKVKKSSTIEGDDVSKEMTNSDKVEENKCSVQMNLAEPHVVQTSKISSTFTMSEPLLSKGAQQSKNGNELAVQSVRLKQSSLRTKVGVTLTYADAVDASSALKIVSDQNVGETPFLLESSENSSTSSSVTVSPSSSEHNDLKSQLEDRESVPFLLEVQSCPENDSQANCQESVLLNSPSKDENDNQGPSLLESGNKSGNDSHRRGREPSLVPVQSDNNGGKVSKGNYRESFLPKLASKDKSASQGTFLSESEHRSENARLGRGRKESENEEGSIYQRRLRKTLHLESETYNKGKAVSKGRCRGPIQLESENNGENVSQRGCVESENMKQKLCRKPFHVESEYNSDKGRCEDVRFKSQNQGENMRHTRCRETLPHRDCDVHPVYLVKNISQQQKIFPNSLVNCPLRARTSLIPKPAPPLCAQIRASSDFGGLLTNFHMGILKRKNIEMKPRHTHVENKGKFVSILPIKEPHISHVPLSKIDNQNLNLANTKPSVTLKSKHCTSCTCSAVSPSSQNKESVMLSVERCLVDCPVVEIRGDRPVSGHTTSTPKQCRYVSILPAKCCVIQSRTRDQSRSESGTSSVVTNVKDFNSSSQQLINIKTVPKHGGNINASRQVIVCRKSDEGNITETDGSTGKDGNKPGGRYVSILKPGIAITRSCQVPTSTTTRQTMVINRNNFMKVIPSDSNNNNTKISSNVSQKCTCETGFRINQKRKWSVDKGNDSGCYPDADAEVDLDVSKEGSPVTPIKSKVNRKLSGNLLPIPRPVMSTSAAHTNMN